MKICPFCAEEIQDEANKCKYCGEWLNQTEGKKTEAVQQPEDQTQKCRKCGLENRKKDSLLCKECSDKLALSILKIIGWVLLAFLALMLWYISLPILAMWYLFYKTDYGKKAFVIVRNKSKKIGYKKIFVRMVLVVAIIIVVSVIIAYPDRKPTITITEPQNNAEIQSDKVLIKGTVSPSGPNVSMRSGNGDYLEIIEGKFSLEVPLNSESNGFAFSAFNKDAVSNTSITIKRIYTDEEKTEIEKKKEEDRIAKEKQREDERVAAEIKKQEEAAAKIKAAEEKRIQEEENAKKIEAEAIKKQKDEELAKANEEKDFKASCTSISYKKLEKDPYAYSGENVYYKGKIEQAGSEFLSEWFRVSVTPMGYGYYSDTMWLEYDNVTEFVEGDIIRFWGVSSGQHCYKSRLGLDMCIPSVDVKYISN